MDQNQITDRRRIAHCQTGVQNCTCYDSHASYICKHLIAVYLYVWAENVRNGRWAFALADYRNSYRTLKNHSLHAPRCLTRGGQMQASKIRAGANLCSLRKNITDKSSVIFFVRVDPPIFSVTLAF
jgi:hypothetical protein